MYHSFLIHSSADGHLAYINSAAMNIGVHVSLSLLVSSVCMPSSGIAVILAFWMLSFKPAFRLSSFTFIKKLFSSSLLSTIRVVSSAHLRLLIFLPAILIPACFTSDCSHEIKRCLLLGKKVMTNLDSILKSRDITLPTKVRLVKAMVFPVVMYGCEGWTVKKAECQRMIKLLYNWVHLTC